MLTPHQRVRRGTLTGIALALCAAACASGGASAGGAGGSSAGAASRYTFAPSLDVNLTEMTERPSGLYVRDFTPGAGNPSIRGDFVRVEYTLYLANGTRLESTTQDQPFEFQLGQNQVIAGMEEAVTGMRAGGRRRVVVPPTLGYGMRTRGNIPGGSVLVYDLHVLYVGR
jgi:peptidylprolyl isomerase